MDSFFLKNRKTLFLISLSLIIFMYMIDDSTLPKVCVLNWFLLLIRLISYSFVGIKILTDFIDKKYTEKEITICLIIFTFLAVLSYQSHTIAFLVYFLYIVAARDIDFNLIIRTSMIVHIIAMSIIFILVHTSIIPNINGFNTGRYRYAIGYSYYSFFTNYFLYVTLFYVYLKKEKISNFAMLLLLIINYYGYYFTKTRDGFYLTIFTLLISLILKYISKLRLYTKLHKVLSYITPSFLFLFIFIGSFFYDKLSIVIAPINSLSSSRIFCSSLALKKLGITLLGRRITYLTSAIGNNNINVYVDSSFMNYLFMMGLLFIIVVLVLLTYFGIIISKYKDVYMLLVFIVFLIHGTFEPQLLYIEFNSFMFVLSYRYTMGKMHNEIVLRKRIL